MKTPSEIADTYNDRMQCVECVTALCKSDYSGKVLVIDTQKINSQLSRYLMNIDNYPRHSISRTGIHYAFLIEDTVYDNLYHSGINREDWVSSFSYPFDNTDRLFPITEDHIKEITKEQFLSI